MSPSPEPIFISRFLRKLRTGGEPDPGPFRLGRKNIYILPTAHGLLFGLILAVMLLGALNYNNNSAFILTFLLAAAAAASILHTFRNLAGLAIRLCGVKPVFAGEKARFEFALESGFSPRYVLKFRAAGMEESIPDITKQKVDVSFHIEIPALSRGLLFPGKSVLSSAYPFEIFRAWTSFNPQIACMVYPKPEAGKVPFPELTAEPGKSGGIGKGDEDFSSLRGYQPSDSPRRVAWKAFAAGRSLMVKEFTGDSGTALVFDFERIEGLSPEGRLSRICRWIIDAEGRNLSYALRLPGREVPAGRGEAHRNTCLALLATYPIRNPAG